LALDIKIPLPGVAIVSSTNIAGHALPDERVKTVGPANYRDQAVWKGIGQPVVGCNAVIERADERRAGVGDGISRGGSRCFIAAGQPENPVTSAYYRPCHQLISESEARTQLPEVSVLRRPGAAVCETQRSGRLQTGLPGQRSHRFQVEIGLPV